MKKQTQKGPTQHIVLLKVSGGDISFLLLGFSLQILALMEAFNPAHQESSFHVVLAPSSQSGARPPAGHVPPTPPHMAQALLAPPSVNIQNVFTAPHQVWP